MRWVKTAGVIALGTVAAVAAFLPWGCGPSENNDPWKGLPGPPRVVASFPPLACFAMNVGGDDAGLLTICAAKGPHGYEPLPEDQQKLRQADLFLVNGLSLDEHFAEKMAKASNNPRLTGDDAPGFVEVGERLLKAGLVDKMGEHDHHDHDADKKEETHGDAHHHGEHDPHVWLGIPQAEAMVNVIRDELKKVDSKRADAYDRRAAEYVDKIKKLHEDGKKALADKTNRKIVTTHESLHYFAESFDLEIVGVIELQPGTEPDPATMQELVKKCIKEKVRIVATEPQFRQKMAETLVAELKRQGAELKRQGMKDVEMDVEIIDLDPLETITSGETLDRGWYERRMRANIDELAKALR